MKDELRGILLDFDGTVAETERFGQRIAYNRAFADLGLDWSWDEDLYRDLLPVAGGRERLHYYIARYRPELLSEAVKGGLITDLHHAKIRNFAKLAPLIPFRHGVQRLVYEASLAGLRVAIATSASQTGVKALLAQDSAMPPMISVIAANEEVERKKPAPDVYLWALDRLNLPAASCIAIEHSRIGLRSAMAAGLTTIITISDYTATDDFTGAAAVLSTLGDYDRETHALAGFAPENGLVDLSFLRTVHRSAQLV